MNVLKKLFCLVGLVTTLFSHHIAGYAINEEPGSFDVHGYGSFTLRLANKEDVEQLLTHFSVIEKNREDAKKIVILPKLTRTQVLLENIAAKRIFVAVDEVGFVCAFTNVYVVQPDQFSAILEHEIRCVGAKTSIYPDFCRGEFFQWRQGQVFVYLNLVYTQPQLRNQYVGSALVQYALNALKKDIMDQDPCEIVMVYKKACGSQTDTLPKRAFASLVSADEELNPENFDKYFNTSVFAACVDPLMKDLTPVFGIVLSAKVLSARD